MDKENLPSQFVDIPGLANFRDIGGWPISDQNGKVVASVRKGIFYRGPDTASIEPAGEAKLRELGITTDFDLRSKGQIVKAGGFKEVEGITRISCPAFPDGQYSPDKAAARYVQYASDGTDVRRFYSFNYLSNKSNPYILRTDQDQGIVQAFTDILTYGALAVRTMLLHVASMDPDHPSSCFIHCTTGNNRSGVFIGIILQLLGVAPSLIAQEYSLSDIGLRPTRHSVVERLMKSPVFANAGGGGRERAERMVGARPESMLAMLDMINEKWGGAEGYMKTACGLTDEDIEKFKSVMIAKESTIPSKRVSRALESSRKYFADLWRAFG